MGSFGKGWNFAFGALYERVAMDKQDNQNVDGWWWYDEVWVDQN